MVRTHFRGLLLSGALLVFGLTACAENYTTNILNGVSSSISVAYFVGNSGSLNYFEINSGGSQTNLDGYIGNLSTANSNSVLITGSGSVWQNGDTNTAGDLYIGNNGSGNRLTVQNGGAVGNDFGYLGYGQSAKSNAVLITGSSSMWQNDSDLYVGNTGSVNQVTIQAGGQINCVQGFIGNDPAAVSNKVVVSDANSLWSNSQTLTIGAGGSFNQLIVTNGGRVNSGLGVQSSIVGNSSGAIGNTVLVTGANSLWNCGGQLMLGVGGAGSRLTIEGGGRVNNVDGQIGRQSTSTNNVVVVTGTTSLWSNSGSLIVGISGGGNSVTIQNGGMASNAVGHLGLNSSGGTNTVLVTGARSLWFSNLRLVIGNNGGANQFTISNGGSVRATNVVIGAGSAGNLLTVLDGYLTVTNSANKATLSILGGTMTLNGGSVMIDRLVVTNITLGPSVRTNSVVFGSGTLSTKSTAVTNGLPFVVGDGANAATLNLLSGTHSFANGLTISSNALLTGIGTITADVTNAGTIGPGNPTGKLTVNGNFTLQSSSVLSFDLGGYTQTAQYDFVSAAGTAALAGQISLSFINGFSNTITNGPSFTLLAANFVVGAFANAPNGSRLQTTDGLADFLVTYTPSSLLLSDYHDLRDSVGDGIPNWWRQQHFGNAMTTNSVSCAACDPDGDGLSNLQEFLAGTDPNNAASSLRITGIVRTNNDVRIFWITGPGKTNALQWTAGDVGDSYNTNSFVDIFLVTSTVGTTTNYLDIGGATNAPAGFYRVRLVP